jgi:hypothetical protein
VAAPIRKRSRIPPEEISFFEAALQSSSPVLRKHALQRMCNLYRRGARPLSPRVLKAWVFLALSDADPKVRRWAFNALAQMGEADDVPLMMGQWEASRSDPEVFEAGLTALAYILPREQLMPLLKKAEVELDALTLMALAQQTDSFETEMAALRLDPDSATCAELRSATLLIGLRKAPDTLFSGRFPVSDVIGDLNRHDDAIVAQYSFWATVEHPSLSLRHIRVPARDFPTLPPNVQGWAYRVLTKEGSLAAEHYEAIIAASESPYVEVREGAAIGLREIYYDSLDVTVSDWLIDESDQLVRERLLEHMAAQVNKSSTYREEVTAAFHQSGSRSLLRSRLEAANTDDSLALEFRRIALQTADPDLFAEIVAPRMSTQNFHGPVTAGGFSNTGTGNSGHVNIMNAADAQAKVLPLLEELRLKLNAENAITEVKVGSQLLSTAIETPTKGTVERVLGWLKDVKEGGEAVASIGQLATQAYDQIAPLLDCLPLST